MKWPATAAGLCIAIAGPLLPVARLLGGTASLANRILEQLYLWLVMVLLIAVILRWEKLPLSSVGLASLRWRSFVWGAVTAGALLFVVSPLSDRVVEWFYPSAYANGLAKLHSLPVWFLVFAGATAGVVEEALYRGYAIERLSAMTGNIPVGALFALAAFVLVHIPFWGLHAALGVLPAGAVLTMLYLWRRDLMSNMVAHACTAIVQLVAVSGSQGST